MATKEQQDELYGPVSFEGFVPPTYEEWKEACEKLLKGAPFDKKMKSKTYEGLTLKSMYWQSDLENTTALGSMPGVVPYLRGVNSEGYGTKGWQITQGVATCDATRGNEFLKQDLAKGGEGIFVALDEATRRNLDEVQHLSPRELNLTRQDQFEKLFEGIDLTAYPLHLRLGADARPFLAQLFAYLQKQGCELEKLSGCIGADPIGELARWGELDIGLESAFDAAAETAKFTQKQCPKLRTLLVNGEVYEAAGANAVQELAGAVCTGVAYLEALVERGLTVKEACKTLRFAVSLGADFFMQIAKIRALRRLWATAVTAFGGDDEDCKIQLFAQTSGFTATTYDPYVNLLRSSTQAFSGVVGGVDGLRIRPFDCAIRESNEQATRVARNQQIMFKTEFDLLTPVDPAGGSWFVEQLTEELAQATWQLVGEIDDQGGIVAALQSGTLQSAINDTLQARFKALASRKDRAVGVNMYANMVEKPVEPAFEYDEQVLRESLTTQMAEYKKTRGELQLSANTLEEAILLAQKGATAGELALALGGARGDRSVTPLLPHRWTEQYEYLRNRTKAHVAAGKENVKVFLCTMGPVPQHKPRADFSRGFFEVGEFEVITGTPFESLDEAAKAALESDAHVAVICSTDPTYPELVPPLAKAIKAVKPEVKVILAGAPAAEYKDLYVESGVDDFIHVKANCLAILTALQNERGMAQ